MSSSIQNASILTTSTRYYPALSSYFLQWYLPCIVTLGSLSNVVCLAVLLRGRIFPHIINLWMVSVTCADLLFLLTDGVWMLVKVWTGGYDLRDSSLFMCKAHHFLSNYMLYFSAYCQTAVSLQRAFSVMRPFRAQLLLTSLRVRLAWFVVAIVTLFPVFIYLLSWRLAEKRRDVLPSPVVTVNSFTGNSSNPTLHCEPHRVRHYYITSVTDVILWCAVPLSIMTITSILIGRQISPEPGHSSSSRDTSNSSAKQHHEGHLVPPGSLKLESVEEEKELSMAKKRSHFFRRKEVKKVEERSGTQVTCLLLLMNAWYVLCAAPLLVYLMVLNFVWGGEVGRNVTRDVHRFWFYLLRSLVYLTCCANFMFYCLVGTRFRRELRRGATALLDHFCFCKRRKQSTPCPRRMRRQWTATYSEERPASSCAGAEVNLNHTLTLPTGI